jgi:hypothetical protein
MECVPFKICLCEEVMAFLENLISVQL